MTGGSGAKAGIYTDEDADQVGGEGVCKEVQEVGVFARWGIARARALLF